MNLPLEVKAKRENQLSASMTGALKITLSMQEVAIANCIKK